MVPPDPGQPYNGQPRRPAPPRRPPFLAAYSSLGQVNSPVPRPRLLFFCFFFLASLFFRGEKTKKSRPLITRVWQKKEGEGEKE